MFRQSNLLKVAPKRFSAISNCKTSHCPWQNLPVPLTKIVATIGPASEQLTVLPHVVQSGMRIMRINFSHATYDEANLRVTNLKLSPGVKSKTFNLRAVMLDTQGPEIRTGSFGNGVKEVDLSVGSEVFLSTRPDLRNNQTPSQIWLSYPELLSTVKVGSCVLLDDGAVEVRVEEMGVGLGGNDVRCKVMNTGTLGNKKGVNMPGMKVALPAMSDKDKEDIRWGIQNDIDYIAASFTRKKQDVLDIREYTRQLTNEFHSPSHPLPLIISKIENTEALENFDEILDASDGIMVARGDLGVEIPMPALTPAQKLMVEKCNRAGKPVIVATQMLESMQKNPRPTRAECTDVANAVIDGADCVMLSGESAKGKYPVQSVSMMHKIVVETEKWLRGNGGAGVDWGMSNKSSSPSSLSLSGPWGSHGSSLLPQPSGILEGIAAAAASASKTCPPACILTLSIPFPASSSTTSSSSSSVVVDEDLSKDTLSALPSVPLALWKFRPNVPVVSFVSNEKDGRMLQVFRGIHPILQPPTTYTTESELMNDAIAQCLSRGYCKPNDSVLVLLSRPHPHPSLHSDRSHPFVSLHSITVPK